jgi:hypothetical protein|tara:strand:- start:2567 stop:2986 length:420 start_codon:yes stop_codon:yes gene_type:complete
MNKKRGEQMLIEAVIKIVIPLLFFSLMIYFATGYQDGAAVWEEFYAKEIVNIVNGAEPGTEIYLDITQLTKIALKNGKSKNEIIRFNNLNNKIIVSLTQKSGTSFEYFNDVDIVDSEIILVSGGAEMNRLYFMIKERQK